MKKSYLWQKVSGWFFSLDRKRRDASYLLRHKLTKRDVFLTRDRKILAKGPTIRAILGISIMSPNELLIELRATL